MSSWWQTLEELLNRGKQPIKLNGFREQSNAPGGAAGGLLRPGSGSTLGDLGAGVAGLGNKSLTDALNAGGAAFGGGPPEPPSLMEQLQQQLGGIQPHYATTEQLQQQANNTVGAQYDPQINELLRQMSGTTDRAHKNQKDVKGMYGALAQDIASQLPGITQQLKANQDDVTARYQGAQQDLQAQYDKQKTDQQNVLTQLGIQAAAPDAQAQAATDQSYFQNQLGLDKQQTLNALAEQGQSQKDYTQNTSNNTRLAGDNASADIGTQLEQYLQGAQGQLGDLRASKAQAIQSLLSQLQQSDYQRGQDEYQNQFNNIMALNKFQLDATGQQNDLNLALQKLQMQQQQAQQPQQLFKGTSGMSGVSNFLTQQYGGDTQHASQISNLISSVLANPEVQSGRHNNAPITNEYLIELLRQAAAQQGISGGTDLNNAIDGLLAYKGQLR